MTQAALAAHRAGLVYLMISKQGCPEGRVHVAVADSEAPFSLVFEKRGNTSDPYNLEGGVDVTDSGCTGASRADGAPVGASEPAITAMPGSGTAPQALALWLAKPLNQPSVCDEGGDFAVEGLGLYDPLPDDAQLWLNGVNEGKPETLAHTTSGSAPAVLADEIQSERGSYVLAHACSEDDERGVCVRRIDVESSVRAELEVSAPSVVPANGASHVALSWGSFRTGAARSLGLGWRSGCGRNATLEFTQLSWTTGTGAKLSQTLSIPTGGTIVGGPDLAFSPTGFTVGSRPGGWLMLWVEQSEGEQRVMAARITERDTRLLELRSLHNAPQSFAFPIKTEECALGYGVLTKLDTDWQLLRGSLCGAAD